DVVVLGVEPGNLFFVEEQGKAIDDLEVTRDDVARQWNAQPSPCCGYEHYVGRQCPCESEQRRIVLSAAGSFVLVKNDDAGSRTGLERLRQLLQRRFDFPRHQARRFESRRKVVQQVIRTICRLAVVPGNGYPAFPCGGGKLMQYDGFSETGRRHGQLQRSREWGSSPNEVQQAGTYQHPAEKPIQVRSGNCCTASRQPPGCARFRPPERNWSIHEPTLSQDGPWTHPGDLRSYAPAAIAISRHPLVGLTRYTPSSLLRKEQTRRLPPHANGLNRTVGGRYPRPARDATPHARGRCQPGSVSRHHDLQT